MQLVLDQDIMDSFYNYMLSPFALVILLCFANTINPVQCCYQRMFTFGDSVTDTGNTIALGLKPATAQTPYGMTYFYAPKGRYCDGRIIIDYIAASQGLEFLPPYVGAKKCGLSTVHGVNFAVAGAPVLNISFYEERNVTEQADSAFSLEIQLGWFEEHLSSVCNSRADCEDYLSTSLFIMGELGGNDYIHPVESGKPLEEVRTYVPLVIEGIAKAVETIIGVGAKTILVPGIFPLGCSLEILVYFKGSLPEDAYDPTMGCLIEIDELVQYHNSLLQEKLDTLRPLYTTVSIAYVNYYSAALPFYQYPQKYGLRKDALFACCGGGGKYNFNNSATCTATVEFVCKDPQHYVVWDGKHMTEKAYSYVVKAILSGEALNPPIDLSCSSSSELISGHLMRNNEFASLSGL